MYLATLHDVDGRLIVSSIIGEENMTDFEHWAFGSELPIEYDESARFLWNYIHRAECMTCPLKEAFQRMAYLWKKEDLEYLEEWHTSP